MKISPGLTNHAALLGVTPDQHHAMLHAIDSALVHSGVITDLQHGVRTLVNAHAHAALSGIGPDNHHAQAHTLASHTTKDHAELTGVGADNHHAQAHTLASHSTKAHSELTEIGADDHHSGKKAIWAQPHTVGGTSSVLASFKGYYGASEFANNQQNWAYFSIPIPNGFSTITKAVIRLIPAATGNIYIAVDTQFAAVGEAYDTHAGGVAAATKAVVANQMAEYDISAALAGVAMGDTVGINVTRYGASAQDTAEGIVYILGVLLEYT